MKAKLEVNKNPTLDSLMDNNPITKLSKFYQNKFITKIKNKFTNAQQEIFIILHWQ